MTTAPTPPAIAIADLLEYLDDGGLQFDGQPLPDAAAAELIRLQAELECLRADQAQALSEASSLAMSLFRKHYSSDPDYASGAVKFGLCDDLRGVISQIDNMSAGLARADELMASKNARIHELEMQALDLASENSILKRAEEAELEVRKPLPLSIERLDELWASQRSFHGGEPLKMGHVEFARLIEVEYGVLGRIPMCEENGGQIDPALVDKSPNLQELPVDKTANLQDRSAPLSDEQIDVAADRIDNDPGFMCGFRMGARFAEREHGITGGSS